MTPQLLKPLAPLGAALAAVGGVLIGAGFDSTGVLCIAGLVGAAVGLTAYPALRSLSFTAWVVAAVVTAILQPFVFQPFSPGGPQYKTLLLLLVQAVMFGMGTQMGLRDFAGVAKAPLPVAIGLGCQFTIMPLLGYGLALLFQLPGEIAAGLVLIGSCSSGLASNVMCYIARANLALSITLTACATLMAPVMTPFWMQVLSTSFLQETEVKLSFLGMMASIVKIVIVPTGAALVHDYLRTAGPVGWRITSAGAALGVLISLGVGLGFLNPSDPAAIAALSMAAWILGGVAFGMLYHFAVIAWPKFADFMPLLSMAGIIYVTGMTTAEGRENLIAVGAVLLVATLLHNVLGYTLGYVASRLLGMDRQTARTVAIEVGMQNGGMATGIAAEMDKLATLGLPAAGFIAWMNVTGSLLANYWRRRPIDSDASEALSTTNP